MVAYSALHRSHTTKTHNSFAVALAIASFTLILTSLATACGGTDPAELEERYDQIVRDVRVGSTANEVVDYLEANDISHGPPRKAELYPQLSIPWLQIPEVSPDTVVIQAAIWGADGPDGINWQIFFVLDDAGKLLQIFRIELGPTRI